MAILEAVEAIEAIAGFRKEMDDLMDIMVNDVEVSGDDYRRIARISDRMLILEDQVGLCYNGTILIKRMETEKDRFEVQKFMALIEKNLDNKLESMIKVGRTWKFKDYKCIDLIKRLTEFLVETKEGLNAESE